MACGQQLEAERQSGEYGSKRAVVHESDTAATMRATPPGIDASRGHHESAQLKTLRESVTQERSARERNARDAAVQESAAESEKRAQRKEAKQGSSSSLRKR
jgi:hypothetical protein